MERTAPVSALEYLDGAAFNDYANSRKIHPRQGVQIAERDPPPPPTARRVCSEFPYGRLSTNSCAYVRVQPDQATRISLRLILSFQVPAYV